MSLYQLMLFEFMLIGAVPVAIISVYFTIDAFYDYRRWRHRVRVDTKIPKSNQPYR